MACFGLVKGDSGRKRGNLLEEEEEGEEWGRRDREMRRKRSRGAWGTGWASVVVVRLEAVVW